MKRALILFTALFYSVLFAGEPNISFEAAGPKEKISASQTFKAVFKISIPSGWHIYGRRSELGNPTKIALALPEGYVLKSFDWPEEKKFSDMGMSYAGYEGLVEITANIEAPAKISETAIVGASAEAEWLACSQICVPQNAKTEFKISQIKSETSGASINAESANGSFAAILFAAFLGGMILNLMPCVFPVIGIKILSFAKNAGGSRAAAMFNALFYTLGIVLSFAVLAGALLILRSAGESLGWGFQLQDPIFSASMALLFFAMALSFAGAFEIGAGFAGGAAENQGRNALLEAFLSGVVAVLVASPCTAPFMGSALGAALSADISAAASLSIFAVLGLGMAFPYIALSAVPQFAKMLPRPGAWMEILKQVLSVPLFATVGWLAWLYSKQTDSAGHIIAAVIVLGIGLRAYGMFSLPHYSKATRSIALAVAIVSAAAAVHIAADGAKDQPQAQSEKTAGAWSAQKLASLRAQGRIVYVDFTAAWCLTCQFNKQILNSDAVRKAFEKKKIAVLTGDWTNRNAEISDELAKFGRAGVPLNLLYAPEGEPVMMPAVLTESALIEAVDKIK